MDYFGDMQIQEYSKMAANQGDGIGLANQLYEQMKRNYGL
jgi:Rod binding domain-containing protein